MTASTPANQAERSALAGDEAPAQTPRSARLATLALVAVGLGFLLLQLFVVTLRLGFSTDEVDYLAKVNPAVPELFWSAVRAWGTPVLAAPVAIFSPGIAAVRLYFSVVFSGGLILAFLPWRRVLHPAVAPLAAFLFATVWITTFFGNNVMPNLPVAYGCIAATGVWAGLPRYHHRRWGIALLGLLAGAVALIRPTDSLLLVAVVAAFTVMTHRRRGIDILLGLLTGTALGWVPWVVEAYTRFGGPVARWKDGSEGLTGIHPGLALFSTYPRLFDGTPGYCCYPKPPSAAGPVSAEVVAWFIAIPVLALIGLGCAARWRRLTAVGLCTTVAAAFIVFYLVLLDYGSPRFLLPVLGLLSIPVAAALVGAATRWAGGARIVAVVACVALVAGHLVLQADYDATIRPMDLSIREHDLRTAAAVKPDVISRPCLLIDASPQVLGYYLGCHITYLSSPVGQSLRAAVATAQQRHWYVFVFVRGDGTSETSFLKRHHWVRRQLHTVGVTEHEYAYSPPGETTG